MEKSMGWNDRIDELEEAQLECLEHFLEVDEIPHPTAAGIARQAIGKGVHSLSTNQLHWWNTVLLPMFPSECPNCEGYLQPSDMIQVVKWESNCTDCEITEASMPD